MFQHLNVWILILIVVYDGNIYITYIVTQRDGFDEVNKDKVLELLTFHRKWKTLFAQHLWMWVNIFTA